MAIIHSTHPEAGAVEINDKECITCGKCCDVCAAEVLFLKEGKVEIDTNSLFGCIACGHCMMVCPKDCIKVSARGISVEDLCELPPLEKRASAEALSALMMSRRSVRRFQNKEVSAETIEQILEMASSAPMGIPPWDVGCISVLGHDKVQEVSQEVVKGYKRFRKILKPWVLELLRPFIKRATYQQFKTFLLPLAEIYCQHSENGEDAILYNAPAALIFYNSAYADPIDASIACTYAMLAAQALGLGSTMIGAVAPMLKFNKAYSKKLGIPKDCSAAIVLILGYPAVDFRRSIKRHFLSREKQD